VERVAAVMRRGLVDATIQEFPDGTPTAEEAARQIGCRVDEIVKTIVFVTDRGFVLALVPGDRRADEAKVAAAVGAPSARVATRDEVPLATGFEVGAVAPFPHRGVSGVLLEQSLLQFERVWIGAGSTSHMAALAAADVQRLANAIPADLVAPR
jgi:prolyl-tRNA editing enzyme YbaK/EbsC (Cys-tRNA(Pro) deacylase)